MYLIIVFSIIIKGFNTRTHVRARKATRLSISLPFPIHYVLLCMRGWCIRAIKLFKHDWRRFEGVRLPAYTLSDLNAS